ncbi:MAG: SET domain-containing protein [Candidatus Aenigmarchaeota archaeon]|nr:SET domain-containing protein [Candidatus Aenigmarchaeota archaeon]
MDVIVRKSKVEGIGVFAARDFKKGEIVLDWSDSPILTPKQAKSITEEEKYIYYKRDTRVLVNPPARFVNHSCDPNTFIRDFSGIAKRDIKKRRRDYRRLFKRRQSPSSSRMQLREQKLQRDNQEKFLRRKTTLSLIMCLLLLSSPNK